MEIKLEYLKEKQEVHLPGMILISVNINCTRQLANLCMWLTYLNLPCIIDCTVITYPQMIRFELRAENEFSSVSHTFDVADSVLETPDQWC